MSILKEKWFKLIKRLVFGSACDSESYVKYLKGKGIKIGEGTIIYEPTTCSIDIQNPKLLTIGDNVRITSGVKILTHDYSWSVLAGVYGECLGGVAPVVIGNNVFIGVNACVLKGVHIGDNVIIGAGSVVTHDCKSNYVYAGCPAKMIMSLEEYYNKKKTESILQIKDIVKIIGEDNEEIGKYLREYQGFFDTIFSDFELLMDDTGYGDKCRLFYGLHGKRYSDISDIASNTGDDYRKDDKKRVY